MKAIKKTILFLFTMGMIIAIASCNNPAGQGAKDADASQEGQMEKIGKKLDNEKAALEQHIKESVSTFNKRMDEYEKSMKEAGKAIDQETDQAMMNLRMKRDTLLLHLNKIGDKTQENWSDFEDDMNQQSQEFEKAVNDFFSSDKRGDNK